MRFFLRERRSYTPILRSFSPPVFPGILCSYARLFEVALGEMDQRFRARGEAGLEVALAEAVAILDRLGNYCFTGDPRVLATAVLGPLLTIESLRKGAWPFVSPDLLDFRPPVGTLDLARWPRMSDRRPVLLHVAALAFHYGPAVAAQRHGQIWFGRVPGSGLSSVAQVIAFLNQLFRNTWIPQMVLFMSYQLRRHLRKGAGRGAKPSAQTHAPPPPFLARLSVWESSEMPFSSRYGDPSPFPLPPPSLPPLLPSFPPCQPYA